MLPFHDTVWHGQIEGARLKDILAKATTPGSAMRSTAAAADIDPAKTYTIATTAFTGEGLAGGGVDTGEDARKAFEDWLAKAR